MQGRYPNCLFWIEIVFVPIPKYKLKRWFLLFPMGSQEFVVDASVLYSYRIDFLEFADLQRVAIQ